MSLSVPLTAIIEGIQEIEMLRKHRRMNRRKTESGSSRLYEHPEFGYFLTTLEQRVGVVISLCKTIIDIHSPFKPYH